MDHDSRKKNGCGKNGFIRRETEKDLISFLVSDPFLLQKPDTDGHQPFPFQQ